MGIVQTQRTVVKSVPELWAELSDEATLGPMLGSFGEIRITRVLPEAAIEWRSELAAGRIELQPSGFGTRVSLSAALEAPAEAPAPAAPPPSAQVGLLARLLGRGRPAAPPAQPPPPSAPVELLDPDLAQGALTAILDEIGAARHRPFSRDLAAPPRGE
jgi:hypothetical protein